MKKVGVTPSSEISESESDQQKGRQFSGENK